FPDIRHERNTLDLFCQRRAEEHCYFMLIEAPKGGYFGNSEQFATEPQLQYGRLEVVLQIPHRSFASAKVQSHAVSLPVPVGVMRILTRDAKRRVYCSRS